MHRVRNSFRRRRRANKAFVQELLINVWRFTEFPVEIKPYEDHYRNLLGAARLNDRRTVNIQRLSDVLQALDIVRPRSRESLTAVKDAIRSSAHPWLKDRTSDDGAQKALELLTRLWLFASPSFRDCSLTLEEDLKQVLRSACDPSPHGRKGRLSSDFSAKSFIKIGGFKLLGTSDISEHLTFTNDDNDHLRIFTHATILPHYYESFPTGTSTLESTMYPDNFLIETGETINLLFPRAATNGYHYARRIGSKYEMDIEAQIKGNPSLNLSDYPLWAHRLAEIQTRYDTARPKQPGQWWYDRRDSSQWAALWIGIIVFLCTTIPFGVISSVTGIIQVVS